MSERTWTPTKSATLKPGWHIDNFESRSRSASFKYPNSREEQDFLPDQDGNELRVGDRVVSTGPHSEGEQAWVIGLDPKFRVDDSERMPKTLDEINQGGSRVRVRDDGGVETAYSISAVRKLELNEVERAEIREEQLRRAIRRTEDVIADYEAHLRALRRRRDENFAVLDGDAESDYDRKVNAESEH